MQEVNLFCFRLKFPQGCIRGEMRELISVTVFMIFSLVGALVDSKRSNSAGVHSRQDLGEQINVCVYSLTLTQRGTFPCMHLSTHWFVHAETHTQIHNAASHTYICTRHRDCYTHTQTHTYTRHVPSVYMKIQPVF